MQSSRKNTISQETLVFNYLPAKLRKYKSGWMVEYYVENPISTEFDRVRKRVQILVNRYRTKREAEIHCEKIIFDINCKLAKGINPLIEDSGVKIYATFKETCEKFINEKNRELGYDSMRSYISFIPLSQSFNINMAIRIILMQ